MSRILSTGRGMYPSMQWGRHTTPRQTAPPPPPDTTGYGPTGMHTCSKNDSAPEFKFRISIWWISASLLILRNFWFFWFQRPGCDQRTWQPTLPTPSRAGSVSLNTLRNIPSQRQRNIPSPGQTSLQTKKTDLCWNPRPTLTNATNHFTLKVTRNQNEAHPGIPLELHSWRTIQYQRLATMKRKGQKWWPHSGSYIKAQNLTRLWAPSGNLMTSYLWFPRPWRHPLVWRRLMTWSLEKD